MFVLEYRDVNGTRRRKSLGTKDRKQAEQKAGAYLRGEHVDGGVAGVHTLEESLRNTYSRIWDKQKDAMRKASMVNALCRDIGHWKLHEVTYEKLTTWAEELHQGGNSGATINRKLACISKTLNEAVKLGHLKAVPAMPRYKEAPPKDRYLSREEELKLLRATKQMQWDYATQRGMHNLLVFLLDTGCRFGEAMRELEKNQPTGFTITISVNKADKPRTIPLTSRARQALVEGWPVWDASSAGHRFKNLCRRAGTEGVTLHTMRHTCASRLVAGGMDLYRVRDWLGHRTITTTERYAHLNPDALNEGVALLEAAGVNPEPTLSLVR
jgi:integrase